MTKHGRVVLRWTQERIDLLKTGRRVLMSQGGVSYVHEPVLGCCEGMRMLLRNPAGRKLAEDMRVCPYCRTERGQTDNGPVYKRKSSCLKGTKRVKGADGHWHFVKKEGADAPESRPQV